MSITSTAVLRRLGGKAKYWHDKGIDFLAFRLRGDDSELAERVLDLYMNGHIAKLPKDIHAEVSKPFSTKLLTEEEIVVVLLGRKPISTHKKVKEKSASLTFLEEQAQKLLAEKLTGGWRYINRRKK